MGFFKTVERDALEVAHEIREGALRVFHEAANDLKAADAHFHNVRQAEQARIAEAQKRSDEATAAQSKNSATIAKLNDLLGTG